MGIVVLKPGGLTTVQDLGRPGLARLGVSAAGAADPLSLRLANLLAGNPENAAALEMTLVGGAFRFETATVVALAGSDFAPTLDGRPLPMLQSAAVAAGQVLACGATRSGARAYLAVRGGLVVDALLGGATTHLPSGLGGVEGRALRAGDRLPIGAADGPATALSFDPAQLSRLAPRRHLRVTAGAQADHFPAAARAALTESIFTVREDSDRMGLRLEGPALAAPGGGEMLSEGMPLGAVQVPPDGAPVILGVDHQTTGGYPVIACVVAADLPALGQLRPRDPVRFETAALEEARALFLEQERWLESRSWCIE
jgi:antagonist of KipI